MKKIFYVLLFTFHLSFVFSQAGYNSISLLTGMSTNNSKFVSVLFEKDGMRKFNLIYSLEAIRYATATSTYDLSGNDNYVAAGLLLSSKLSNNRNYSSRIFFGAMAGTDNSYFVWYPVIGFKQNINLSSKFSLLFQERGAYIFNLSQNNWQASLHFGCRMIL